MPAPHGTCWQRGTQTPWLPAPLLKSHRYPERHVDCPVPGALQLSRHSPCGVHQPDAPPKKPPQSCSVRKHVPVQYPPGHVVRHSAVPRTGW